MCLSRNNLLIATTHSKPTLLPPQRSRQYLDGPWLWLRMSSFQRADVVNTFFQNTLHVHSVSNRMYLLAPHAQCTRLAPSSAISNSAQSVIIFPRGRLFHRDEFRWSLCFVWFWNLVQQTVHTIIFHPSHFNHFLCYFGYSYHFIF